MITYSGPGNVGLNNGEVPSQTLTVRPGAAAPELLSALQGLYALITNPNLSPDDLDYSERVASTTAAEAAAEVRVVSYEDGNRKDKI